MEIIFNIFYCWIELLNIINNYNSYSKAFYYLASLKLINLFIQLTFTEYFSLNSSE